MMLHRHFEAADDRKTMTTTDDLSRKSGEEFVSDIFPPEEDKPKRKSRKKSE